MIIERVCLHPDTATPSEKKIAGIFMYSTRDVFDDTKVEFTKSIKETAKAAIRPKRR